MAFVIETETGSRVTIARSGDEDPPEVIIAVDQFGPDGDQGAEARLTVAQARYLAESLGTQLLIVEARAARGV